MKKYIAISIFIIISNQFYAQTPYHNMEKYWWYRYRLVNDFMTIGEGMGKSLPAQSRKYPDIWGNNGNSLDWQDCTVELGHYIGALAMEYRILKDNNWDTWRTEREMDYAIKAINRLDALAEPIDDYVVMGGDISPNFKTFGTLPSTPSSWSPPWGDALNNYSSNSLNGYFLRDDIYFDNNTVVSSVSSRWGKTPDLVSDFIDHFNRVGSYGTPDASGLSSGIGRCPLDHYTPTTGGPITCSVDHVIGCAAYDALPTPSGFPSGVPSYPNEESQDQTADMFLGLGLAVKVLDDGMTTFGSDLRRDAADAAWRIGTWIPKTINSSDIFRPEVCLTETVFNPFFNDIPATWLLRNPRTMTCVMSGLTSDYGISQCFDGASGPSAYAPAIAFALKKLIADKYVDYTTRANILRYMSTSWTMNGIYQYQQSFPITVNEPGRDIEFSDIYSCFSDTWRIGAPWPFDFLSINTTWKTIRNHSMDQHFCAPHLPLVYRIVQNLPDVGFCPECHTGLSYKNLLDGAPECGPYFYHGEYANAEWSGSDRLTEWFHRSGYGYTGIGIGDMYIDWNGLDYMMLFGLYVYKQPYLPTLINPYYTRNFNNNYPVMGMGSTAHKLTLNYLEYISMINKIYPGGNLTIRGAKVIDLEPGYDAAYGSYVDDYIQDYVCQGGTGSYHYALDNGTPFEYNPTYLPFHEKKYSHDDSTNAKFIDSIADIPFTNTILKPFRDSINILLNNNELAPEAKSYLLKMGIINADETFSKKSSLVPDSTIDYNDFLLVFPDPANTLANINYQLFDRKIITIQLINALGQQFNGTIDSYEPEQMPGKYNIHVNTESLIPGIYYIKITIDKQIFLKKLTVIH